MESNENKLNNQNQTEDILRRLSSSDKVQTENIVKRVLTSEVKYLIAVVVFIFGVVAPYYQIKQDIELIKQNHLAHIETMQKDIERLVVEQDKMKETEIQLMQTITERLPKK